MVEAASEEEKELAAQMAAEFLNDELSEQQFSAPKAGPGMWASFIRVLDPIKVIMVHCMSTWDWGVSILGLLGPFVGLLWT